jgi:spermidine synthase
VGIALRTAYADAEVVPEAGRPWRRLLRLDGEDAAHVDLRDPARLEFAYVRRLGDVVDVIAPRGRPIDALFLGGGGFTLPRYLAATRPGSRSVVAEIDAGILALARAHLGLRTSPALRVRVADARTVLARRRAASADLVVLDAFRGSDVPAHLATLECARLARRALRPHGVYAINVIDEPPLPVARAQAATLAAAFAHVALVAARKIVRGRQAGNVVLLAATERPPTEALRTRALRGPSPELVLTGADVAGFAAGARPLRD